MRQIFITPKKFGKLSKGKSIKSYPNPWIKEIEGVIYNIVNQDMECRCKKLPKEEYKWSLGVSYESYQKELKEKYNDDNADVFVLSTIGEWFPTELIADTKEINLGYGIIRNAFSMFTSLSEKTGYLQGTGLLGSSHVLFKASKVSKAISILNKNGYNFILNKCI